MSTAEQPSEYVTVAFDAGVATVTIDHPPVNLLTIEVLRELSRSIRSLAVDDAARAVVLRSANPEWFIAHFDVAAIAEFPTDPSPMTELTGFDRMCELLRTMPKPTIAEIRGRAGGGGSEIALACDMRFVTPDAVLNQPEVGLGILPGGGGTVRLPRLVGRGRALEAILGCEDIDAATAERWGWVNRVLATDEIEAFVDRLARRIASFPAHAVAAAKASVVAAEMGVGDHLLAETAAFDGTLAAAETRQRLGAFLASGGQTEQGERRLGDLVGELGEAPES